jgi:hypothetical protein
MAGLIYDSSEMSRIQDLLNKQEKQMVDIDKEKKNTDSNVLRYAIIGGGAVVLLVLLKIGISYKKK